MIPRERKNKNKTETSWQPQSKMLENLFVLTPCNPSQQMPILGYHVGRCYGPTWTVIYGEALIMIIIGNLWRLISWKPRALKKQISMPHPHTHTHTNTPHPHMHAHTYTHTHTHTHTHPCKNTSIVVMGLMETEERSEKSVGRREEVGFQFWLERGEWRGLPYRERKRVPDDRSDILKGSLPKSPPAHPWDTENLSIWGWTKRMRRRIEVKQERYGGAVPEILWKQVRAILYWIQLLIGSDAV